MGQNSEMMNAAWKIANDSLRTTLCIRFKADKVAVACIYLAARQLGVVLPEDPPWWDLFDVTRASIEMMCESILAVYELGKTEYRALGPEPPPGATSPVAAEVRAVDTSAVENTVSTGGSEFGTRESDRKEPRKEGERSRKRSRSRERSRERGRSRDGDRRGRRGDGSRDRDGRRNRSRDRDRRGRDRSRDRGRDRSRDDRRR